VGLAVRCSHRVIVSSLIRRTFLSSASFFAFGPLLAKLSKKFFVRIQIARASHCRPVEMNFDARRQRWFGYV
jgi:hypothetical protein